MKPNRPDRIKPKVFVPVAYEVLQHPKLNLAHAVLHGYIWSFQKKGRRCFTSQRKMAEVCGLSKRYAQECLLELEKHEFITVTPRFRENGSRRSSEYRVIFPPDNPESRPLCYKLFSSQN